MALQNVFRRLIPIFAILNPISISMATYNGDIEDIFQFFPDCQNDGLNLRWAHAVNSWELLNATLNSETANETRVHMIEGDVILRESTRISVMAHPPATDSNLTFEDWLKTINSFQIRDLKVGAKADFKSLDAAKESLKIIQQYRSSLMVPLWLNADIVRGPGFSGRPVNAKEFLRDCTDFGPNLTLSIGWTTPKSIDQYRCRRGYAWLEILALYHQIVPFIRETAASVQLPRLTFAVRASLVKPSYQRLLWLLDACVMAAGGDQFTDRFSITLWTSSADQLTQDDYLSITYLRLTLGKDRVFIDLPPSDIDCLKELDPHLTTPERDSSARFDASQWEAIDDVLRGDRIGLALLGQSSIRLRSSSYFVSRSTLKTRLIIVPSPDQSSDSILISILGASDDPIWTVELSSGQCHNSNCLQLRPQEPYSISITIEGCHVTMDWKREDDVIELEMPAGVSLTCDTRLNCTKSSTDHHGSSSRQLSSDLSNFKFMIEKIGKGDVIFEKLLVQ